MDATTTRTETVATADGEREHPFTPEDIEGIACEYEDCFDNDPLWRRTFCELENGDEALIDYDNVESAEQIRKEPWRLIAEPEPAPNMWDAIKLRTVGFNGHRVKRQIAQVTYDHRPGYLRRVTEEVGEHQRSGREVIWIGAPEKWSPPIGITNRALAMRLFLKQQEADSKTPELDLLCIERNALDDMGIVVLGDTADGSIRVYSRVTKKTSTIRDVSRLKFATLLQIGGQVIRGHVVRPSTEEPPPSMHSVADVQNMIALLASERRIATDSSCGQGFHLGENGKGILVDAGSAAVWDYSEHKLTEIFEPFADGRLLDFGGTRIFDFVSLKRRLAGMTRSRITEAVRRLDRILSEWRWKRPNSHALVAGLILATFIQTVWKWRPQVAVTGEASSAKTLLFETIDKLFAGLAELCSKPSEAGLRQLIANRAIAILVDEFERSRERTKLLELFRTGSRGAKILRGTVTQKAMSFGLRHITWVASIESGLTRQPDLTRFIRFELQPPVGWMNIPDDETLSELGQELLAAAIFCCQEAVEVCDQIRRTAIEGVEQRRVESYAVPAAMLAVTGMYPSESPEAILRTLIQSTGDQSEAPSEPDQLVLLRDILSLKVIVDRVLVTVGEVLDNPVRISGSREVLGQNGVKRCGSRLFVSHQLVQPLLKGTDWDGQNIKEILARLPGAETGLRVRRRCGGVLHYGTLIPWPVVEQFFGGEDEIDDDF